MFHYVKKYNPFSVAIEISGQQQGFVQVIEREMGRRNCWFNLASDKKTREKGIRPNTNKLVRFNNALPLIKQGKIQFPKELEDTKVMREALDELSSVTLSGFKSRHDDFCDTISQIPLLTYITPNNEKEEDKVISYSNDDIFNSFEDDYSESSSYIV